MSSELQRKLIFVEKSVRYTHAHTYNLENPTIVRLAFTILRWQNLTTQSADILRTTTDPLIYWFYFYPIFFIDYILKLQCFSTQYKPTSNNYMTSN